GKGRAWLCRNDRFSETSKWQAAWPGRGEGLAGKSGSFSTKASRARRIEEPDARDRGRDKGVFRHRRAPEERPGDGAAVDRYAENEDGQGFRFAPGRKGTRSRARGDREDAGRIEVLGFPDPVRNGYDLAGRKRHGGAGGLPYQGALSRSEEHTSELQSPYDLVCRLL